MAHCGNNPIGAIRADCEQGHYFSPTLGQTEEVGIGLPGTVSTLIDGRPVSSVWVGRRPVLNPSQTRLRGEKLRKGNIAIRRVGHFSAAKNGMAGVSPPKGALPAGQVGVVNQLLRVNNRNPGCYTPPHEGLPCGGLSCSGCLRFLL
jgi:hypothetical protein